jgi:excisionase family DNA binding protein
VQHGLSNPPKVAQRPLLSTGSAAALAGCHRVTIVRAIQAGELEAVRLGRTGDYRVPVAALNDWLRPAHNPNEEATS